MFVDPAEKRAALPSWIISTVVHSVILIVAMLWVTRAPQGAAEETVRDIGIVLKRSTADGVEFDGEEDVLADQTSSNNTPNPTPQDPVDALPDMATNSNSADSLPELPALGSVSEQAGGSATNMASAGGTRGGLTGDVGDKANVQFFGVTGTGTKFVYLVDRSASMEGDPLAAAKQQIIESLASLDSIHQFQIMFFNTRATPLSIMGKQRIAYANDINRKSAAKQLQGITADLGTDRINALKKALRLGPDVVFFLTDADGPMTNVELNEVAIANRNVGASICTIEFGLGPDPKRHNFLRELAARTGGQYGYVNTNRLAR